MESVKTMLNIQVYKHLYNFTYFFTIIQPYPTTILWNIHFLDKNTVCFYE